MRVLPLATLTIVAFFISCSVASELQTPATEQECISMGGKWVVLGLTYPGKSASCDFRASDFGKSCADSTQCLGECLAPNEAKPEESTTGTCSEYLKVFGCFKYMKQGVVESLCVD